MAPRTVHYALLASFSVIYARNDRDELEYWVVDAKRKTARRMWLGGESTCRGSLRQGTSRPRTDSAVEEALSRINDTTAGSSVPLRWTALGQIADTLEQPISLQASLRRVTPLQSEWTVHGLTVPPHFSLLPFLILKPPLARKLPADIMRRGSTMRFKRLRPGSFTIGYHDGRSDSERAPVLGKSGKALTSRGTYDSHTTRIYGWPQTTFVVAYWTRASWNVCAWIEQGAIIWADYMRTAPLHSTPKCCIGGMYLWPLWHYTALSTTVKYQSVFQMLLALQLDPYRKKVFVVVLFGRNATGSL
ncbi:hypothetical protein B0H13DRAFT_1927464 [Mycena leptocephala]|nr:hypothetical protein B0H13DRAFT_1927464 [Mycena leptocephala]